MIHRHELPNGVRVITESIPTVRSVAIGIWIGTGSRYETKEENGISHFLEHMFFKGTKTRSAREIAESFDRIGGQVNAFTSKEYTCYYAKVLDEHATYALDILADMFFNSSFENEELEKEKNVVYEEIKMYEDTPDDIVHDMLSQASFGSHSLAYPILGTRDILETFTGDDLRAYMDKHYTAGNVVISIAGNIKKDFIEKVRGTFEPLKKDTMDRELTSPTFMGGKMARKKETEQAHLCIGYKGLSIGQKNIYSLVLLNNILGGSMSSRLFQEVREKRGLAYSVFSYHSSYHDNGLLTIYGGTASEQLDQLFETVMDSVNDLQKNGITEKELSNGKEQLKGNLMLSLESTNSRMSRNGKNELLLKKHRSLDDMLEVINEVTTDHVNQLASSLFSSDYSLSLVSPSGKLPQGVNEK